MGRKILVLSTLFCVLATFLCGKTFAQGSTITGKVVDASTSEQLIGASIQVKGTTVGTVTNVDGAFTIKANAGATLVVSYVGYSTKEVVAVSGTPMTIALESNSKRVEELVVVGYGNVKKSDATGSLAVVSEKSLNKSGSTSPQQMIVGKIAGVNVTTAGGAPTDGATIRIRGGSSMSASNDPLIIVDGLPLDNRAIDGLGNVLSSINPNDIETFTVLKDASATAIYGSRASNGVILITTKKGAKGEALKVDFDSKFSLGTVAKKVDLLSADEYRTIVNKYYEANKGSGISDIRLFLGNSATDWQDEIFRNSFGQDYNISVTSSVKSTPIRASVGYTDQEGVLKTSEMKRYSGTLKVNPTFFDDHLRVDIGLKGIYSQNVFAETDAVRDALRFDPTKSPKDSDAKFTKFGGYYTWISPDGQRNINATRNPVARLDQRSDKADVKRLIGDVKVDYKLHFLPDLKASVTAGLDYTSSDGKIRIDPKASWVDPGTAADAQLTRDYTQETKNEMVNFVLNYRKELPSIKSQFEAMVGVEEQRFWRKAEGNDVRVNGTTQKDGSETENYLVSYFGRLNYSYDNKYLLTATLRRDGSSRFSKDTRWGVFPAFAFAWKINEESFIKNVSIISNLKFRLGYGVTGQQDITNNDYPYMGTYRYSDGYSKYQVGDGYVTTIRPNAFDDKIKWEETSTYNAGVDFGFFKGRLNGTVDLYIRKTNDLINTIPVPAGSNYTDRLLTNIGNLENKGFEVSLNGILYDSNDWFWELGGNFSINRNKITKLTSYDDPNYAGVEVGGISGGTGNNVQIHAVGHPINTFYLYEQKYDANGKPIEGSYVDRNKDGAITPADKYYAKDPAADALIGYSTMVKYKNFDLSLSGRVSIGNYVYDDISSNGARYQNLTTNNFLMNLPVDIKNTQFVNSQFWSDYYMKDASFIKLDNITLGYNFGKSISFLSKTNLNLRFFGAVQNVFVVTKYKGIDPEVSSGIDNAIYPRPRTFVFGVSAKF